MTSALGSMVVSLALDDAKYVQGLTRAEFNAAKAARIAENEARKIERASMQAQKAVADMATQTGISSKQMAASLRGVPAQFTDIVVSLQGGQAPLTVFLQQGGQLKDMFGGAGQAARALGGYVLGLVNPFSVAVAGGAAVLLAIQSAANETQELRKNLLLSGGASGASLDELTGYAARLGDTFGVTQGAASAALGTIVSTGKVARTNLEDFTKVAIAAESSLGISVKDIAANLKKLGEDPVSSVIELNKQFNFLDVSTFKQIIAAQKLGNTFQAIAIAQTAYMDALKSRSAEMKENLGTLETGWKALGNTAKEAWDKMLNIGREQSLDEQIGGLQKSIAGREKAFATQFGENAKGLGQSALNRGQKVPIGLSEDQAKLEGLLEQRRIARSASDRKLAEQEQRDKELAKLAESAKPPPNGGKQLSEFDKYIERLDKQEQALKQLSFEEIAIDDLREGRLGKLTKAQEEDLLWRARKQDSIKETAKINAAADAAEAAGIQRIRSEKEQQIAEGKRLAESLATPAEILAAKEEDLQKKLAVGAIDQDTYHRARLKNNNEYSAALEKTTEAGRRLTESLFTPADKLAKREEEYQRLLDAGEIKRETYDAAKKKSIEEYLDDMDKASGKTKDATSLANELGLTFASAFEDAIVGGKGLSEVFKGLEKDIARILIRKQVTEPFTQAVSKLDIGSLFGGLFGGGGGIASGIAGSAGPLSSFAGGGYTGDGARSGGMDGQGGYLAMLHPQESVIDHAKGQSMGGGTSINQSITIDARGADAGVTERIMQAMRQTKAETLAAVQAQANRGGSFARAVGRA